jgi:hypothetical protein
VRKAALKVRVGIVGAAAMGVLAASAAPAPAAVTIGQVGDSSASNCTANFDWVQHSIASGSSYVVPGTGTITSWTTFGGPAQRQLTMKIFEKINDTTYRVVGHDGPRIVAAGGTAGNTFPASVPVRPGNVLGFHVVTGDQECAFGADPGDRYVVEMGNLADGQQSSAFSIPVPNFKLNIQATFEYDNTFSVAKTKRNKKKGTATLTLNLPNPGDLTASGGAKVAGGATSSKAFPAGLAKVVIRAKGKKKATLNETGKVKVRPKITYTPTGGDPGTQTLKVKLRKKLG